MSDRDANHMLVELQEARAEVDLGRHLLSFCLPYVMREYLLGDDGTETKDLIDRVTSFLQTGVE